MSSRQLSSWGTFCVSHARERDPQGKGSTDSAKINVSDFARLRCGRLSLGESATSGCLCSVALKASPVQRFARSSSFGDLRLIGFGKRFPEFNPLRLMAHFRTPQQWVRSRWETAFLAAFHRALARVPIQLHSSLCMYRM